jgi:polar amino acid transport system substrate-binding protein
MTVLKHSAALRRALIFSGLALGLAAAPAQACGPYRVVMYPTPGLTVQHADGRLTGPEPDIVMAMAQRSGCQLRMQTAPLVRIWPALAAGEVDIVPAALATPERLRLAEFIPIVTARQQLLLRRSVSTEGVDSAAAFSAQPQLQLGWVTGAVPGGPSADWLQALRQQGRITEAADKPALMRAFKGGRFDAIAVYPAELAHQEPAWWRDFRLVDAFPGSERESGWALSLQRVNPDDRARLQAAAQSLHRDGSIRRTLLEHLGPELAETYKLP